MKIVVSLASCASNTERIVLRSFYQGIQQYYFGLYNVGTTKSLRKQHNIELVLAYDHQIDNCDFGIQFGASKNRPNEHHQARQNLGSHAKHVVHIETPILGRTISQDNLYPYYRVGLDGFLYGQGQFVSRIDPYRLAEQKDALGLPEFTGWRQRVDGNILLLTQLPGDASLRGQDMAQWTMDTIRAIRRISKDPIMVRLHPALSHKGRQELLSDLSPILLENHANLTWNDGVSRSLEQDLADARVCVTYTSGASVDAVVHGVPVIAMDQGCMAYPISNHWIENITNLTLHKPREVRAWLDQIANSQWNIMEMRDGRVWGHVLAMVMGEPEPLPAVVQTAVLPTPPTEVGTQNYHPGSSQ